MLNVVGLLFWIHCYSHFFCFAPVTPPGPHSGNDATHLVLGSLLVSGKEVVFFEMEWPGFEPRASEEDALSTPPRPTWQ